jgi:aldose 1-epimerase
MAFQITTQPFGTPLPDAAEPLTEYFLENTDTGEFATILPEFGAIARRLVLRKNDELYSLLVAPDSTQALVAGEGYASSLLYPFAGRVRDGIYHVAGQGYALPMNEVLRDNAIHGLVADKPFAVVADETTPDHARLTLRYDYAGDLTGYPFPFRLTVVYTLSHAGFSLRYSAQNVGMLDCPAAFGWHPYFSLNGTPIDELTLSLPSQTAILLDDRMLPTGHTEPLTDSRSIALRDRQLDTPFVLPEPAPGTASAETVLTDPARNVSLVVSQEVGPGRLNYLVCYTPPKRDCIAIEPQTANVDAFNTGEGLVMLRPGDVLEGRIGVDLL